MCGQCAVARAADQVVRSAARPCSLGLGRFLEIRYKSDRAKGTCRLTMREQVGNDFLD